MPNVLSPKDLDSRPDNMDETVLSSDHCLILVTLGPIRKLMIDSYNLIDVHGSRSYHCIMHQRCK